MFSPFTHLPHCVCAIVWYYMFCTLATTWIILYTFFLSFVRSFDINLMCSKSQCTFSWNHIESRNRKENNYWAYFVAFSIFCETKVKRAWILMENRIRFLKHILPFQNHIWRESALLVLNYYVKLALKWQKYIVTYKIRKFFHTFCKVSDNFVNFHNRDMLLI